MFKSHHNTLKYNNRCRYPLYHSIRRGSNPLLPRNARLFRFFNRDNNIMIPVRYRIRYVFFDHKPVELSVAPRPSRPAPRHARINNRCVRSFKNPDKFVGSRNTINKHNCFFFLIIVLEIRLLGAI